MSLRVCFLVDTTYLCHRAWHATGRLSHDGEYTGVAFGVLRDIENILEIYEGSLNTFVFAFDHGGPGLRGLRDPNYKKSRVEKELTEEEKAANQLFFDQVDNLKRKILPSIGYKNIFCKRGYEGDDIIAAAAEVVKESMDDVVIITGDNDLWQCLDDKVSWRSPSGKVVTFQSFRKEWEIDPEMWASVKALAGCSTDDVEGIKGVGEKTAAKWFNGQLKPGSKKYQDISNNLHVHNRNLPLVKLPYPGLELPGIRADGATEDNWRAVKDELGIRPARGSAKRRKFQGFNV